MGMAASCRCRRCGGVGRPAVARNLCLLPWPRGPSAFRQEPPPGQLLTANCQPECRCQAVGKQPEGKQRRAAGCICVIPDLQACQPSRCWSVFVCSVSIKALETAWCSDSDSIKALGTALCSDSDSIKALEAAWCSDSDSFKALETAWCSDSDSF